MAVRKRTATIEQAAALDFEPMNIGGNMSPEVFRARAAQVYSTLGVSTALLAKGPVELAELLLSISPDDPTETVTEIGATRFWLEGIVSILHCTEARMMVALAKVAN